MKRPPEPRKQRTREHINADLSIHHVEGFILNSGHTVQRLGSDYGYDLMMWTFDEDGYAEPSIVYFQLKAMERFKLHEAECVFDLDIRDYNLWTREEVPVILVLYDAGKRKAVWLPIQRYFSSPTSPRPRKDAKTVRVRIPQTSVFGRRAVSAIREIKRQMLDRPKVYKP
jgi:hypothetical protein